MSVEKPSDKAAAACSPYHHGDLREALVRSAEELLEERGSADLSLREAAKRAGVSHAAPYRHFRSKSELLEAVAKAGFERLSTYLAEVRERNPAQPVEQLRAAGQAYVKWAIANPERTRLMYGGMMKGDNVPDDLHDSAEAAYAVIFQVIDEGRKAGIFAGPDTDTMVLSAWSLVHGLTMLLLGSGKINASGPAEVTALVSSVCETALEGIQTRHGRAGQTE